MLKRITLFTTLALLLVAVMISPVAAAGGILVDQLAIKIQRSRDNLTANEQFCLIAVDPQDMEGCLEQPLTPSTRDRQPLIDLAVAINSDVNGDPLTPMEKFCLLTSEPGEELGNCLDGYVN